MPAVLIAAMLSAVLWLRSAPAYACSCGQQTPAEGFAQADAVFEGHVQSAPPAENETVQRTIRMRVVRAWKGIETEQVEVMTPADSAVCGYEFVVGQSYFVYATKQDGRLAVSLCSRTRPMANADEDQRALGMGVTPVEPGAGATHPRKSSTKAPARGGCASCQAMPGRAGSLGPGLMLALWGLAARSKRRRTDSSLPSFTDDRRPGAK